MSSIHMIRQLNDPELGLGEQLGIDKRRDQLNGIRCHMTRPTYSPPTSSPYKKKKKNLTSMFPLT